MMSGFARSLNYDLRERDMIALFSVFGPIVDCDMTMDSQTGRSKGFCFIDYADPVHAEAAMTMNGFEIGGRRVCL
jgi:RNA recognition motif-containing protein